MQRCFLHLCIIYLKSLHSNIIVISNELNFCKFLFIIKQFQIFIVIKQNMNITFTPKNNYQQQYPNFTAMKKNQFKGIDLLVVNKFKAPIEQFDEMADFKRWVKHLLDKTMHLPSYKHFDPNFNRERMLRLFNWKQYLTKENPILAACPALMLVIYNGITKNVKAENTEIPPLLNAGALAKTIEEMENFVNEQKNPQYNFLNHYVENLRETEQVGDTKISENFNGWVVIPSKKNDNVLNISDINET